MSEPLEPHDLFLMLDVQRSWDQIVAGKASGNTIRVMCPECGRLEDVDRSLWKHGDYYCDGSSVVQFRQYRVDVPTPSEVVSAGQIVDDYGVFLIKRILDNLRKAQEDLTIYQYFYTGRDDKGN